MKSMIPTKPTISNSRLDWKKTVLLPWKTSSYLKKKSNSSLIWVCESLIDLARKLWWTFGVQFMRHLTDVYKCFICLLFLKWVRDKLNIAKSFIVDARFMKWIIHRYLICQGTLTNCPLYFRSIICLIKLACLWSIYWYISYTL